MDRVPLRVGARVSTFRLLAVAVSVAAWVIAVAILMPAPR